LLTHVPFMAILYAWPMQESNADLMLTSICPTLPSQFHNTNLSVHTISFEPSLLLISSPGPA